MRPVSILVPVLVAALVAIAALVFAHGAPSAPPSTVKGGVGSGEIAISNYLYGPASTTVKLGTTVTFTNRDSVEHTATSDTQGVFDTGTLNNGQVAHVKLTKLGSFSYHCSFHAFMHATITVVR